VAKSELGTKRLCGGCGAKFYDLNKSPITCPKCDEVFTVVVVSSRARPEAAKVVRPPVPKVEPEILEVPEAELVSLEEADAEAEGAKKPAEGEVPGVEEEVEMDESLDDAAFIQEQEEEDEDVTEIIGGDIEGEEET